MTEPTETPRQFVRRINLAINSGKDVQALIDEYTYAVYRLRSRYGFIEVMTIEGWLQTYRTDIRVIGDEHEVIEPCEFCADRAAECPEEGGSI